MIFLKSTIGGNLCNGFTGNGGGSFDSVEDCMDAASLEFDPSHLNGMKPLKSA